MIAVQAVTVGAEVTELMARLEAEGEFAEQLFVHGLGVQTAEGLAEWLHYEVRAHARHPRHAGTPLLLGLSGGNSTLPCCWRAGRPRSCSAFTGVPSTPGGAKDGSKRMLARNCGS